MNYVNRLRAELIYSHYKSGNCSIVVSDIFQRYLMDSPSITERGTCKKKGCSSKKYEFKIPFVALNEDEFDGKLANMEKAIMKNFPTENSCRKCRQPYNYFERTFNHILFIEVALQY